MLGWHGPLFEVRALGAATLAEGQGAAYHPELQPAKTLAGMLQVARGEARSPGAAGGGRERLGARDGPPDRPRVVGALQGCGPRDDRGPRRRARARLARLGAHERRSAGAPGRRRARLRRPSSTRRTRRSSARPRRSPDCGARSRDARASSVPRAVVDSLEGRLKDEEARAARSDPRRDRRFHPRRRRQSGGGGARRSSVTRPIR